MEDKNLLFIIQQKGINNWIDIAVSLGTNRTPFQCLSRYQRSLNASILKREWTKDEDDKLRSAVATVGQGDWQAVASALEGRTGPQCSNRWKKSLDPGRTKRGSFTPDEDHRLKIAVLLFGPKNWNKKAEFLPGRNQVQCRERWFNVLDPSLRRCDWTEEEDLRLEVAIREHGYSWAKVAACVPSRTDNDCRRRWKKLFPNEVPMLQEARRIQKAALISNFVDRESERPALGPSDFQPLPNIDVSCDATESKLPTRRNMKSRMPTLRKEKKAIGDTPKKIRSSKRTTPADGVTDQVGIANKRSSVPNEEKSKKPQRKINRGRAMRKVVPEPRLNNDRCAEQNLDAQSSELQLNSRESDTTNVDKNVKEECENRVAEKPSRRDVCFSEGEHQNSTGSSGVSVVSETANDKVDGVCKQRGRRKRSTRTSNKSQDALVSGQAMELDRLGTNEDCHNLNLRAVDRDDEMLARYRNKSKKRKRDSADTSLAWHPNVTNPILASRENGNFSISPCGQQPCSLQQYTPGELVTANRPEGSDRMRMKRPMSLSHSLRNKRSDGNPLDISPKVDNIDDDQTLASFLRDKSNLRARFRA